MEAKENRFFLFHVSHDLRALTLQLSYFSSFPFKLHIINFNTFHGEKVKGDELGTCAISQ
jgi:hypothetical protein